MCEYSFIVPVLNEENKLEDCLTEIKNSIKKHNMDAEIIVVDNGSSDNSKIIAKQNGARVFCCSNEGYGNAINFGISKADGKYSIMGDADGSYDFFMIDSMISKMHNSDIIVGNRFTNKKEDNKIVDSKRMVSKIISKIANKLFKTQISDYNCGFRIFNTNAVKSLALKSEGQEINTEMILIAQINKLRLKEVSISFSKNLGHEVSTYKPIEDFWKNIKLILKIKLNQKKYKFNYIGDNK